jgi:putative Holliday junction resolvase
VTGSLLGVDLGERRIGLAIAPAGALAATPLATIRRGRTIDEDAAALARIVREQGVGTLVVGLPLEANGGSGPMARAAVAWGEAVAALLGVPVRFRDERLTSHLAEQRVGPIGRGRSGGPPSPARREAYRSRVDREAAAIILQDELDAGRGIAGVPTAAHAPRPEDPPR